MRHGWILIQTDSYGGTACRITEESEVGVCKYDNTKKKINRNMCSHICVLGNVDDADSTLPGCRNES